MATKFTKLAKDKTKQIEVNELQNSELQKPTKYDSSEVTNRKLFKFNISDITSIFKKITKKQFIIALSILLLILLLAFSLPKIIQNNSTYDIQTFEKLENNEQKITNNFSQKSVKYFKVKYIRDSQINKEVTLKLIKNDGDKSRVYQNLTNTAVSSSDYRTIAIPTNLPVGNYAIFVFENLSVEYQSKLIVDYNEFAKMATQVYEFKVE